MTRWQKVLVTGGAVSVALVVVLALLPFLFRDRIVERVRIAINDAVDARVDFGAARISLLRSFPDVSFTLDDLSVIVPEGDTLLAVPAFRLVLDLGSVIGAYRRGDELVVRSISLDRPYVHARVLADGTASWDIRRDDVARPASGRSGGVRVGLRSLTIEGGRLVLDHHPASTHVRLAGVDHTLSGDFTRERFTLRTETEVESADVRQLDVPYLAGARVALTSEIDADLVARRFALRENRLRVNEVALALDGSFAFRGDLLDLNLTLGAEETAFQDILSLVPAIYREDFESLQSSGRVAVGGRIEGTYGPDDFPSFGFELEIGDGAFRYPDQPVAVRDVFVNLAVLNPGGDADSTRLRLDRLDLVVGDDPFHARAVIATPLSDPEVELAVDGRIDLAALARALALEGELQGVVTADASAHTRLSWLQNEEYDRVSAGGGLEVTDLRVRAGDLPVAVAELRIELTPRRADLTALRARVGSSDFAGTGVIDNLLGFALYGQKLRGRATVTSDYIALDEWRSESEGLEVIPVPPRLDLALSATVGRMTLGDVEMTDARGSARVLDERMTLDDFRLRALGGEMIVSGWYETLDPSRPAFAFDVSMRALDVRGAFTTFNTVRVFAPAAGYASGRFSADLVTAGTLESDMTPVLAELSARGSIRTAGMGLEGVPALHRIADALAIERLRDPALQDFTGAIEIRDGRLYASPFVARVGGVQMNVSGSNGLDGSLDYRVAMEAPVPVEVAVGGTWAEPTIQLRVDAAREEVERRVSEEAAARAESLVAEAEERAAEIRGEGERVAGRVRSEANAQADRLVAEATNPLARQAAQAVADRLRREGEERATQIEQEADRRARQVVDEATELAEAIRGGGPAP